MATASRAQGVEEQLQRVSMQVNLLQCMGVSFIHSFMESADSKLASSSLSSGL